MPVDETQWLLIHCAGCRSALEYMQDLSFFPFRLERSRIRDCVINKSFQLYLILSLRMPSEYKDAVQGQQSFWQPSGQITHNKWTVGCSESKATGGIRLIRSRYLALCIAAAQYPGTSCPWMLRRWTGNHCSSHQCHPWPITWQVLAFHGQTSAKFHQIQLKEQVQRYRGHTQPYIELLRSSRFSLHGAVRLGRQVWHLVPWEGPISHCSFAVEMTVARDACWIPQICVDTWRPVCEEYHGPWGRYFWYCWRTVQWIFPGIYGRCAGNSSSWLYWRLVGSCVERYFGTMCFQKITIYYCHSK